MLPFWLSRGARRSGTRMFFYDGQIALLGFSLRCGAHSGNSISQALSYPGWCSLALCSLCETLHHHNANLSGLPLWNIRCVECMGKRTMREQFVQIENFACRVVDGLAPLMLSALALKIANGELVAAKTFIAAVAVETQ